MGYYQPQVGNMQQSAPAPNFGQQVGDMFKMALSTLKANLPTSGRSLPSNDPYSGLQRGVDNAMPSGEGGKIVNDVSGFSLLPTPGASKVNPKMAQQAIPDGGGNAALKQAINMLYKSQPAEGIKRPEIRKKLESAAKSRVGKSQKG